MFKLPSRAARASQSGQRGVTLVEALVALLVMSFGMIALVGLMGNLRRGADLAKQRSEAMRIARAEVAQLRTFSLIGDKPAGAAAGVTSYKDILNEAASRAITLPDSNTTYAVQHFVDDVAGVEAKRVRVSVGWTDRAGDAQTVKLDTIIAGVDPFFSAAVGFTPQAAPVARPSGRNPVIPDAARKLDKNTSAFKPSSTSDRIWVFNNLTGVITSVCTLASGVSFDSATASDLTGCSSTTGYLLSGTLRFSNTNPARPGGSAGAPEATALPVDLTLVGGDFTVPTTKLSNGATVTGSLAVSLASTAVPANAQTLANNTFYCFNDYANAAQSFVNYNCLVTPNAGSTSSPYSSTSPGPRVWSGQLQLTGLSTGTAATQYRVCRYSADYNGNGGNLLADGATLDNQEHPLVYVNVAASLARQNFLVIRGDVSCPTASAVDPAHGIFADYSTAQLQP